MRNINLTMSLLVLAAALVPALECRAEEDHGPLLRVHLADAPQTITISCERPCTVMRLGPRVEAHVFLDLEPQEISATPKGLRVNGRTTPCSIIDYESHDDGAIRLDGKSYPGTLRVIRTGKADAPGLALVNLVPAERYLMGVLGSEMPLAWETEALKAQVVAARTYALYYELARAKDLWDVVSTVEDQVYSGGEVAARARKIVEATRGEVLTYEGKLFPAFFHSTCGGHTDPPGIALGHPEFDFLEGVDCDWCKESRHYRWEARVEALDLAKRLGAAGFEVKGPIAAVAVREPQPDAPSPQRRVLVTCADGEVSVAMVDFRRAVGRMDIKSARFECRLVGDIFHFTGSGLGHGAGMCQYGAQGLAKAGRSYRQILAYYYTEAKVERRY